MPTNDRAVKGEKNKKTTDDPIPGKEKSKDRRDAALPQTQTSSGKSSEKNNQNDDNNGGDKKPKKKDWKTKKRFDIISVKALFTAIRFAD